MISSNFNFWKIKRRFRGILITETLSVIFSTILKAEKKQQQQQKT